MMPGLGKLDMDRLINLQQKPLPFTPGEPLFWNDPHIAWQMLTYHLNPETDAASRRPEIIDRSVAWMVKEAGLKAGVSVIDLGCGPGLYTARMAERGLRVTGVDFSPVSIEYARQEARTRGLEINYRFQNYLDLDDEAQYEAAFLIYGDFCPLSPEERKTLLVNIHRALKPGGIFILDVSRVGWAEVDHTISSWYASSGGFWRPGPHLVLELDFSYPELSLKLDQYIVIEENEEPKVYRNWRQEYTPESITAELAAGRFEVISIWQDLWGTPLGDRSEWLGVIARKV